MNVEIAPGKLSGSIRSIQSKSDAHRTLICAALAGNRNGVELIKPSEDLLATLEAVRIFEGAGVADCNESGTTLRLLFPVAAALGLSVEFTGRGRLPQRPMEPMLTLLKEHGCIVEGSALPIKIHGRLTSGEYRIPGHISSQYISGLLLALPLLAGQSRIRLTSPLESAGYVDMTLNTMRRFGVEAKPVEDGWLVEGNQNYKAPFDMAIEGDWSNSAFWLVANALGSRISVKGLRDDTCQMDSEIKTILSEKPSRIDVRNIPDLVPILAVWACARSADTVLENCARLRLKESDRIRSVCAMLLSLGGSVEERGDCIVVHGSGSLRGGEADSVNDHRIAMAAAVASTICKESVVIKDAEAVNKSYPDFFKDFISLGGKCNVI